MKNVFCELQRETGLEKKNFYRTSEWVKIVGGGGGEKKVIFWKLRRTKVNCGCAIE